MHMRLHINLDDEMARQIDEVAGSRKRSRYIREAIEAKLEVDRRVAARRRLVGSYPDFAPWMTPEWISENRKREGRARDEQLSKHWRREE
jgi:hypothetical protein